MPRKKRQHSARHWEHPASPLQAARYERRLTGEEVCAQIRRLCPGHNGKECHLEQSKLSDYEREKRSPGRHHTLCFIRFYGKSAEALGLARFRDSPDGEDEDTGTLPNEASNSYETKHPGAGYDIPIEALGYLGGSDDVRRDTFIKGMGAAGGAAFFDPIISMSEQAQEDVVTTAVSNRQVERLAEATLHHAYNYYDLHKRDYLQALLFDLGKAGRLLQLTTTSTQRLQLENAYARLAGITGAYFHSQRQDARAIALFESAEEAARACGDTTLQGWLYARHCALAYWTGGPRGMLALVERGLEATASSRESARLHSRAARTYAIMGDRQKTEYHLGEAERLLGTGSPGGWPEDPSIPLAFSFTGNTHGAALCALRLGDYKTAIAGYEHTLESNRQRGLSPRTDSAIPLSSIRLGTALAHTGELQGATQLVTTAVGEYQGVAVPNLLRHAREFSETLTVLDKDGRYAREFADFLRARESATRTV